MAIWPASEAEWIGIDPVTRKRTHHAVPVFYPAGGGERAVVFQPGYITSRETFGQHGMDIIWYYRGPRGVVDFGITTGWVPGQEGIEPSVADCYPMGRGIATHARAPQFEGHEVNDHDCFVLGGPCYWDVSYTAGDKVLETFLVEGEKAIWAELASWHDDLVVP